MPRLARDVDALFESSLILGVHRDAAMSSRERFADVRLFLQQQPAGGATEKHLDPRRSRQPLELVELIQVVGTSAQKERVVAPHATRGASQFVGEVPEELIHWKREGAAKPAWTGGQSINGPRFSGSYWGAGAASGSESGRGLPGKAAGRVQPQKEVVAVSAGDKVNHTTFGNGTVLAVEGGGDKMVAKVRFDIGEKRLLLRYAPLTKVG